MTLWTEYTRLHMTISVSTHSRFKSERLPEWDIRAPLPINKITEQYANFLFHYQQHYLHEVMIISSYSSSSENLLCTWTYWSCLTIKRKTMEKPKQELKFSPRHLTAVKVLCTVVVGGRYDLCFDLGRDQTTLYHTPRMVGLYQSILYFPTHSYLPSEEKLVSMQHTHIQTPFGRVTWGLPRSGGFTLQHQGPFRSPLTSAERKRGKQITFDIS